MATITIDYEEYLALLGLKEQVRQLEKEKVEIAEGRGVLVKHIIQRCEEDFGYYEYPGMFYYEQIPKDELFDRLTKNQEEMRVAASNVIDELKRLRSRNWLQRLLNR